MHAHRILQIEPMAAPRPRARAIKARSGKTFVSMYNPAEYMRWKENAAAILGTLDTPFTTPVQVEVNFYCARPKTTKLDAPKPDIDNYLKGLLDAVTDAGWWSDDTLVHSVLAAKNWALPGREGSIHLFIQEITK